MKITIEGSSVAPSWVTTQEYIRQALNLNKGSKLVRIARVDGGHNYHAHGEYNLDMLPMPSGDMVQVLLIVR